jgi:hypothetical protein
MTAPPDLPRASMETRLVKQAARLARHCAGLLADSARDDWQVYYAIDADIVGLYMNPASHKEYADVFGGGDPLLARLIGDYLMLTFGAQPPAGGHLFLVPPHDEQVVRMLLRITGQYTDDAYEAEAAFDRLAETFGRRFDAAEPSAIADWLIANAGKLIEVFDGSSGPALELRRWTELGDERLLSIERHVGADGHPFPLPALADEMEDLDAFAAMVDDWRRSLSSHRSRRQPQYSVDEDAIVLATVEWINRALDGEKAKLVLVTGTSGIWSAAASANHLVDWGIDAGSLFSDAYIRHPQAFMAHRDFFFKKEPGSDEPVFNLVAWLNLVFPNVLKVGSSGAAIADISLLPASDLPGGDAAPRGEATSRPHQTRDDRTVITEWSKQVKAAAVARRVDPDEDVWSERASKLASWLRSRTEQPGWTPEQLRADIVSTALRSLSALYSSTMWLGMWQRLHLSPDQARGIPSMRFEPPYELGQECYRRVIAAMGEAVERQAAVQLDLHRLFAELDKVDSSKYTSHVIHAIAYATKGHWYATRTLCLIALPIANDLRSDPADQRRGREAAYLLAVSERRLARSVADIDIARGHLAQAMERQDPGADRDLRFESERLALDVAAFNFRHYVDGERVDALVVGTEVLGRGTALLRDVELEPVPEVALWVAQQVVTATLNMALAATGASGVRHERIAGVDKVLAAVNHQPKWREAIADDPVAEFMYVAACAVFEDNAVGRRHAARRLATLSFPCTRPYDEKRAAAFRALASSG